MSYLSVSNAWMGAEVAERQMKGQQTFSLALSDRSGVLAAGHVAPEKGEAKAVYPS